MEDQLRVSEKKQSNEWRRGMDAPLIPARLVPAITPGITSSNTNPRTRTSLSFSPSLRPYRPRHQKHQCPFQAYEQQQGTRPETATCVVIGRACDVGATKVCKDLDVL